MTENPQAPSNTGYGVATFLLGAVSNGSLTVGYKEYDRAKYVAGFIQDDWRVTRTLTLNYGLRYDLETSPVELFNHESSFNLTRINPITSLPGVLDYAGINYKGSPVPTDMNNFGPRFGFAETLGKSSKTVIRGGYGILYMPGFENFLSTQGWSATTSYTNPSLAPVPVFSLSQGPSSIMQPRGNTLGPAAFLGSNVDFLQSTDRISYVQQWNFGFQRELPDGWIVEADYVGSKGTKLSAAGGGAGDTNVNQLNPQYLSLGKQLQNQVPNPLYSEGVFGPTVALSQTLLPFPAYLNVVAFTPHWGSSIYHALQVRAERRISRRYSVLLSYTNGKLIDDVPASMMIAGYGNNTGVGTYQNNYDRRADRSLDPADVSQQFVASHLVELPFGQGKRWLTEPRIIQ